MYKNKNFTKYFKAYTVANVAAMVKNNRKNPEVCNDDFSGRLVVITGATSGIGYLTARKYASKGADLLCINRNREKSEKLKHDLETVYSVSCEYLIADMSNLEEVNQVTSALIEMERPIDVLIHNAGVYLTKREVSNNGIEKVFMVHYLSSFMMNYRLMEKLKSQKTARIIMVNSEGHRFAAWGLRLDDLNWEKRSYSGLGSYGSAKLAQLQSMLIFQELLKGTGITINAMHPGAVKTETGQENGAIYKWFKRNFLDKALKPADLSAEALYYLGVSNNLENTSGKFYNLTTLEEPAPPALDIGEARILWYISLKMAGLDHTYNSEK